MDNAGRILLISLVLAVLAGLGIVILDKDYRPKKIAETNSGVFSNVAPELAGGEAPEPAHEK